MLLRLLLTASAASAASAAADYDESAFRRLTPAEARREFRADDAPQIPFVNFSSAYVKRALATSVSWVDKGAVTPVKNQGPHGYACTTIPRPQPPPPPSKATTTLQSHHDHPPTHL